MNKTRKTKERYLPELVGIHKAVPIILSALAAFIALCFLPIGTGWLGPAISGVLLGLFGGAAFALPVLLVIHAVFYKFDIAEKTLVSRVIFSSIALITLSSILYLFCLGAENVTYDIVEFYSLGAKLIGGGAIGNTLAYCIIFLIGPWGLGILAVAIFALYITFFFSKSRGGLKDAFLKLIAKTLDKFANIESGVKEKKEIKKNGESEEKRLKRAKEQNKRTPDLYNDDFFAGSGQLSELRIDKLGIHQTRDKKSSEENPILQESVRHEATVGENDSLLGTKFDYGIDLDEEPKANSDDTPYAPSEPSEKELRSKFKLDEAADDVFTHSFDPFDMATNRSAAYKRSSKASPRDYEGIAELAEPIVIEKTESNTDRSSEFEALKESYYARLKAEDEQRARQAAEQKLYEERTKQNTLDDEAVRSIAEDSGSFVPVQKIIGFNKSENEDLGKAPTVYETISQKFEKPIETQTFVYEEEDNTPINESIRVERTMVEPTIDFTENEDDGEDLVGEIDEENGAIFTDEDMEIGEYDDAPIPKEEQNERINDYRQMFSIFEERSEQENEPSHDSDEATQYESYPPDRESVENYPPDREKAESYPPDRERVENYPPDREATEKSAQKEVKEKKSEYTEPDYSDYKFPPIDLLKTGGASDDENINAEIQENAERIIDKISSFNVTATVKSIDRGPRITRYEIVPARGVKVNAITNLYQDIVMALAVDGVRMEAPIPGKSAIGFEVPNKKPSTVFLRDLIEDDQFMSAPSKTKICVGMDVTGSPVYGDIAKMPHLLVAGATGMGKSVCINAFLLSLLYRARPDEIKLILIDPKKVEFNMYNGIPHLLVPAVTDPKQAAGALMWAVDEMERRFELIEGAFVRNIDSYNEKMLENPSLGKPMSKIVIVIDELNDLMLQVKDPVEGLIMRLTQKARAAGIHIIIGTQRPSVNVITGVIKANIPSRISCKVSSSVDSKTILDLGGAEKLLNNGDMLYMPVGTPKPRRVQGAFVSDGEVEKVIKFLKSQAKGQIYSDEIADEINRAAQKCSKKKDADMDFDDDDGRDTQSSEGYYNDRQFLDAVDVAIKMGKISVSGLQRKLSIGFQKAGRYVDMMEDLGIVGEANGSKPRDVLITRDEWHERLARTNFD